MNVLNRFLTCFTLVLTLAPASVLAQMMVLDEDKLDAQQVRKKLNDVNDARWRLEAAREEAARAYRNSAEGQAAQRRMEQDMARDQANRDAEKRFKEHEKRMKRQADCEREKRTGKMAYALSSACW